MDRDGSEAVDKRQQQLGQDGTHVVLAKMSPKDNAPDRTVASLALNRSKRSSHSLDRVRSGSKRNSKATDESDADSEHRMVIQSSDSDERDAKTNESDKNVRQNGAAKASTSKRKASVSISLDDMSDEEDFAGFGVEGNNMTNITKCP